MNPVILHLLGNNQGFFVFFFQADDGIRDLYVTGVQTCALPIFGGTELVGPARELAAGTFYRPPAGDRKSVVEGKSVDLGGRRIIKKKRGCAHRGWPNTCERGIKTTGAKPSKGAW